jgi:hypothetical protein
VATQLVASQEGLSSMELVSYFTVKQNQLNYKTKKFLKTQLLSKSFFYLNQEY